MLQHIEEKMKVWEQGGENEGPRYGTRQAAVV